MHIFLKKKEHFYTFNCKWSLLEQDYQEQRETDYSFNMLKTLHLSNIILGTGDTNRNMSWLMPSSVAVGGKIGKNVIIIQFIKGYCGIIFLGKK